MSDVDKKPEFPKNTSSISGGEIGWSVEVRLADYKEPIDLLGMIVTNKWKKFESARAVAEPSPIITIPAKSSYSGYLERNGLMEYSEAQALRWSLHAHYNVMDILGLALETRLIRHDVTYSFTCKAVSAHQVVCGEDRSNVLPDWGQPKSPDASGDQ